jgi:hypothetical protein
MRRAAPAGGACGTIVWRPNGIRIRRQRTSMIRASVHAVGVSVDRVGLHAGQSVDRSGALARRSERVSCTTPDPTACRTRKPAAAALLAVGTMVATLSARRRTTQASGRARGVCVRAQSQAARVTVQRHGARGRAWRPAARARSASRWAAGSPALSRSAAASCPPRATPALDAWPWLRSSSLASRRRGSATGVRADRLSEPLRGPYFPEKARSEFPGPAGGIDVNES